MKKFLFPAVLLMILCAATLLLKAQTVQNILVKVKNITLVVNGKAVTPSQSSFPSALDYNGTLYIPIRLTVEALNMPVRWDQKSQTISIGGTTSAVSIPPVYLSDLSSNSTGSLNPGEAVIPNNQNPNPISASQADAYWFPPMKIKDQVYGKGISFQLFNGDLAQLSWQLGGRYASLTGVLGLDSQTSQTSGSGQTGNTIATVTFTGDGRTLASIEIGGATTPSNVNIPLSGVNVLTIQVQMQTDSRDLVMVDFVNPLLQ